MEFLDDLRNQQDAKPQPQDDKSGRDAHGAQAHADQDAWGDLLAGVQLDAPDETSPADKGRGRAGRPRLTGGQRVLLGILAVAVIVLWGAVILAMAGGLPASLTGWMSVSDATPTVAVVSLVDATPIAAGGQAPTPTAVAETNEGGAPPARPTATATAIPAGPIATSYDERLRQDPTNVDLYIQRGYEYLSVGAPDAAGDDFERAIALDAERAEAYEGLGWARYDQFQWQEAEDAFGSAVSFNEDLPTPHFGLGLMAYYRGDYEAATNEFDWAAELDRQHTEYEAWLAIASARLGNEQEALGAVARAISLTDQLNIVYIAQSWTRVIEEPPDIDGAQGDLLYARDLEPNDFLTLNAVAQFYLQYRPERLSEAEQLATYAHNWAANDVEKAVALQTLGEVYLAQGRMGDAQQVLAKAADLASQDGEIVLAGLAEDVARAGG